jgi:hypothetical protein
VSPRGENKAEGEGRTRADARSDTRYVTVYLKVVTYYYRVAAALFSRRGDEKKKGRFSKKTRRAPFGDTKGK